MLLVGLLPLWIYAYQLVAAPRAIDTLFSNPPALAGLPLGVLLDAIALLAMAAGIIALRRASSTAMTVAAVLCLTVPAAVVVAAAPVLVTLMWAREFPWIP